MAAKHARRDGVGIVTGDGIVRSQEGELVVTTRTSGRWWRGGACALALFLACVFLAGHARAQEAQGYVRVLKGANMHAGVGTSPVVLFMLPAGTVLPVIERVGRDGVWVTVRITPEVRKQATRMRWRNEERGFVHASTLEFIDSPTSP